MANVCVEARPKGRPEGSRVEDRFNWGPGNLMVKDPETGRYISLEDYATKYPREMVATRCLLFTSPGAKRSDVKLQLLF
jgi:hypothetical protein